MDSARSGSKHSFGMDWRSSRSDGTGPTVVTPVGPRPSVGAEMARTAGVDARDGLAPGLGDADAATWRDARRVVAIDVAARDEGTEAWMPIAVIISAGDTRLGVLTDVTESALAGDVRACVNADRTVACLVWTRGRRGVSERVRLTARER